MSSRGAGEGSGLDPARIEQAELSDDDPLDRLLGDQDMLLRLQLENFSGPMWARVAEEFARYGLSVWRGWMYSGKAYIETSRIAPGTISAPEERLQPDEIDGLLNEVVARALVAFRDKVLRTNKWDYRRGASLKTFFIGQCKFQFRDVYRQFDRDRRRHSDLSFEGLETESVMTSLPSVETQILDEEARQEVLSSLSTDQARQILELKDLGYEHLEIAEILNLDHPRVVTNALHYQRRRLRGQ